METIEPGVDQSIGLSRGTLDHREIEAVVGSDLAHVDVRRNRLQIIGGDLRRGTGRAKREIEATGDLPANALHVAAGARLNADRLRQTRRLVLQDRRLRHCELAQLCVPDHSRRVRRRRHLSVPIRSQEQGRAAQGREGCRAAQPSEANFLRA